MDQHSHSHLPARGMHPGDKLLLVLAHYGGRNGFPGCRAFIHTRALCHMRKAAAERNLSCDKKCGHGRRLENGTHQMSMCVVLPRVEFIYIVFSFLFFSIPFFFFFPVMYQ